MTFEAHGGSRGRKRTSNPLVRAVNRVMVWRTRRSESATLGSMKLLVLTTTGRRSGVRRETPLAWFPAGPDAWLVVASANGAAKNPDWYHNLAAQPDDATIEVGGRVVPVTAEQLHGHEREAALAAIVEISPNFAGYNDKTDREIPVIRLTARPAPGA
ncbi:nitroreductase family deazaflavin-dependent oxidoreductase [Aeromicrobium sp.]|uniref:nitroreductase family deazaflavin-dependent oxidoreductase n=1 Tax=Aeromicrobium sp. TaxID=1871063 RepID=UPI0028B23D60|nr:nitroreductase family deazaflavin-dependent oxidoreductase [Aeromicrobium sp.]